MARPDDITLGDADLIPLVKKSEWCDYSWAEKPLSEEFCVLFWDVTDIVIPSSEMQLNLKWKQWCTLWVALQGKRAMCTNKSRTSECQNVSKNEF